MVPHLIDEWKDKKVPKIEIQNYRLIVSRISDEWNVDTGTQFCICGYEIEQIFGRIPEIG